MHVFKHGKWDLSEPVKDPYSSAFSRRLHEIDLKVKSFQKNKKILGPKIFENKFLSLLRSLEEITEKFSIVSGYASLEYSTDTQSDKATALLMKMRRFGSEIENRTLFFDQWWKKEIDEKNAQRLMQSAGELHEFLRYKRLLAKYSLTEPEEKIINTLDVTGHSALVKLYDKITNAFEFIVKIDGKTRKYNREELSQFIRSPKSKTREMAYKALLSLYEKNKGVLGEIYQNIALNWKDECIQIRGYSSPISVRNIGNDVDDKTVNSLLSVSKRNSDVFRRFFDQKARILNVKKLRRYDIYAPIQKKEEKKYGYDKAVRLVLQTLNNFDPKLGEFARMVFVEKRSILVEHLDDLYSTISRQAYFTVFEITAHKKIGDGATVQDITTEYMKTLQEQFGSSIVLSTDFGVEWTCIPHFYHSPFYCYSYSFGNLLALSMFQRYRREGRSFAPAYLEILSAGGSKKPEELLKDHGIDISSEAFWQEGFQYIRNQTKRLGELIN